MEFLQILQHLFAGVTNASAIVALVTIAIVVWYIYSGSPKNLPPGPLGLPILGYLPFLNQSSHKTFDKLAQKYGPVFRLYFGNRLVIVLNNYEAIKEAFVKQGEVFSGRPQLLVTNADPDIYNLVFADLEIWKVHRHFAFNVLRDLGVGKFSIEPQIMEEIQCFVKELKKFHTRPTEFSKLLTASISNNICILIFGKRFEYDDPWFISARNFIDEFAMTANTLRLGNFFPWIRKLPGINKMANQESFIKHRNKFKQSMMSRIKEFKKHHIDGQRDNYINAFIEEQKANKKNAKDNEMFHDDALEQIVRGLMGAGSETTANNLKWCIVYMSKYQEVQRKVQKEIDDVIGTERAPCWNDRLRTSYTEATLNEIQRMATMVPTSIPHRNTKECEMFGYTIPKDTFIVPNLWAVHNDNKLWKNPDEFRPERFLTADGKFQRNEHLIPFSIGKRECLGISLAKMELYLYFATMLQKFTFRSTDGSTQSLESGIGIVTRPKYFNIVTTPRDKA